MDKLLVCPRCGFEWTVAKNKLRQGRPLCESCKPYRKLHLANGDRCLPWTGHFAEDWVTPVRDNGKEVFPGRRTCGHRDCINPRHIEKE